MAKPKATVAQAEAEESAGTTIAARNPEQAIAKQNEHPEPFKMEPGKTYVTRLPGHSRPVFVRKRRYVREYSRDCPIGFTAIARNLFSPRQQRSYSLEEKHLVRVSSQPNTTRVRVASPPVIYPRPAIYPLPAYQTVSTPPVVTTETVQTYPGLTSYQAPVIEQRVTMQHQCGSCGRYRSADYQRRHPLAPGEVTIASTCRSCARKYASSDTTDDEIHIHRKSHKSHRSKHKYRKTRRSYVSTSSDTDSTTSEEEVRVIRKTLSLSRTRSVSREGPSITITLDPAPLPPTRTIERRSSTIQPVEYVERTQYVDYPRRSSHYEDYTDEEPVEYEYHRRSYSTNRAHSPYRGRRIVSYGYDGDYAVESDAGVPATVHQRSSSLVAEHGTPYKDRDSHVDVTRYRSPFRSDPRRRVSEKPVEYQTAPAGPSRSARVIYVSHENGVSYEVRGSERIALDTRASYTEGSSRREGSTSRHSRRRPEVTEAPIRHHRGGPRVVELNSSDEYPVSGTYPIRPARVQRYTARQSIEPPPVRPRNVYLTPSLDEDRFGVPTYGTRTRVVPEQSYEAYIPPPAPTPVSVQREVETSHRTRFEQHAEDSELRRYYFIPDNATFYPER